MIFAHRGAGVVVHATTVIEPDVMIYQHVLIAASNDKSEAGDFGVRVRSQAIIGAGATIMCPRDRTLTIGRGARIAAGSIVTADVPDGGVVKPSASQLERINPPNSGRSQCSSRARRTSTGPETTARPRTFQSVRRSTLAGTVVE